MKTVPSVSFMPQNASKKTKEDWESERWQSKWSDIKAGQNNFGGFHPTGRARYAKLHRHIAKIKKKEETKAVEKEILKAIQYGEGSESKDEELEIPLEATPKDCQCGHVGLG